VRGYGRQRQGGEFRSGFLDSLQRVKQKRIIMRLSGSCGVLLSGDVLTVGKAAVEIGHCSLAVIAGMLDDIEREARVKLHA